MRKVLLFCCTLSFNTTQITANQLESNRLFDWAETHHSHLFSPADAPTTEIEGYVARHYKDTDIYLGTREDQIYIYGDQFGGLERVGPIIDYIPGSAAFSLNILHINDHHSHLNENVINLDIHGTEIRFPLGGFARVISKISQLDSSYQNVLKLHAGDAITGTPYYTLFKGKADAEMMNQVCFDAFALGDHEFDLTDAGLKTFLDFLQHDDCKTSVLAANVLPERGVSPLALNSVIDYIRPYVVKDFGGELVGIIGINIAQRAKISSYPDDTTLFLDETRTAQRYIDELTDSGVRKIVLMTHQQYDNDKAMIPNLSGVDIVVGGDSHTLLGSRYADFGLKPAGGYPTVITNKDGDPTCLVHAWQYSNVVGHLTVEFDDHGRVQSCTGTPHMLLGDNITQKNANGNYAALSSDALQSALDFVAATEELSLIIPDATATGLLSTYTAQIAVKKLQKIGNATLDLCLEGIPGEGRSLIPGCTELTSKHGGHAQQLVAQAFRERVKGSDIAIQNASGVRSDISAGDITIATVYEMLPYADTLVQLDMIGAEIVSALEDGVATFQDNGGSSGSYPYASGLRWDLDLTKPFGNRFSNFEVMPVGSSKWQPIDLNQKYKVTTNSFLADGGAGYSTFKKITEAGRSVNTYLEYAETFINWLSDIGGVVSRPENTEFSTQSFISASLQVAE